MTSRPIQIHTETPSPEHLTATTGGYDCTASAEDCDIVFLNHRIKSKSTGIHEVNKHNIPIVTKMRDLAIEKGKPLVFLCGGDRPPRILPDDEHTIVFKTSINTQTMPGNEHAFGVAVPDQFRGFLEDPPLSVGFVGHTLYGRRAHLEGLEASPIRTNFILRDRYYDKPNTQPSRQIRMEAEYLDNLGANLFTFCYRGAGNFSVRFYATLMMGRIPIVVNTHCLFPYDDVISYDEVGLFLDEDRLQGETDLADRIEAFYARHEATSLLELQRHNRAIYERYFSDELWERFFDYCLRITRFGGASR